MIEKNRLIELIQETNQSSTREWLEQFNQEDLRLYLDHLEDNAPDNVYHAIPGLLNKQSSLPLVAMPRSNIKNRMGNQG